MTRRDPIDGPGVLAVSPDGRPVLAIAMHGNKRCEVGLMAMVTAG